MSGDLRAVEKYIKEILVELKEEKVLSVGVHASSTRGVQASPSTACRSGPSDTSKEKRSKHHNNLENVKLIPSILLDYIPPMAGMVICDSVPRDFEYTLITTYLPKGICAFGLQLGQIMKLNINDFNLGDCNNYGMLAPHKRASRGLWTSRGPPFLM
jgi:hypothetical protein